MLSVEKYNNVIDREKLPEVSVVIISNSFPELLYENLKQLRMQKGVSYEIILVSNGYKLYLKERFRSLVDVMVELNEDTGAYMARNIGAMHAKGEIIAFVDDDGVPVGDKYLKSFKDCFDKYEVVSVRGACESRNGINPPFYKPSEFAYPTYPTLEGNCAFLKSAFMAVGGWEDMIRFGGGGFEIGIRLLKKYPHTSMIYSPEPVLTHDYISSEDKLSEKQERQNQGRELYRQLHPEWRTIYKNWMEYYLKKSCLVKKGDKKAAEVVKKEKDTDTELFKRVLSKAAANGFSFQKGRFHAVGAADRIVKELSKIGFIPYWRRVAEPKEVEFRKGKLKLIVRIRSRR